MHKEPHTLVDGVEKYMGVLEHCATHLKVSGSATVVPLHFNAVTQLLVSQSANVPAVQFLTHF